MSEVKDAGAAVTEMLINVGRNDMVHVAGNWAEKIKIIKDELNSSPSVKLAASMVAAGGMETVTNNILHPLTIQYVETLWDVVMRPEHPWPMMERSSAGGGGKKRRKSRKKRKTTKKKKRTRKKRTTQKKRMWAKRKIKKRETRTRLKRIKIELVFR